MKRYHLFEIHDQSWCPKVVRDSVTGIILFMASKLGFYRVIAPNIIKALRATKTKDIVDLCSGSGGPWSSLINDLPKEDNFPYNITFTDIAPNISSLESIQQGAGAHISFSNKSVDATNVPSEFKGFRTMFAAFHHFDPELAQSILKNAVDNRVGIGIFELTERTAFSIFNTVLGGVIILFIAPFLKPFQWTRLLLTYLIPIIPFAIIFDGVVSCLRTYTTQELQEFTKNIDAPGYTWDIGRVRHHLHKNVVITYLIGYPQAPEEKK